MPKRDAAHMEAQRERIVRAAIECIGDKGIERTSVANICRKAKLSPGALYVHFSNKDEIVYAALRYGNLTAESLPTSWRGFKTMVASLEPQLGFDISTVIRVRLHLRAESVHPGRVHDVYKPLLRESLDLLAKRLQDFADTGEIRMRMSPAQTALSISSFIDGVLWNALASDHPLDDVKSILNDGLDMFVEQAPAIGAK